MVKLCCPNKFVAWSLSGCNWPILPNPITLGKQRWAQRPPSRVFHQSQPQAAGWGAHNCASAMGKVLRVSIHQSAWVRRSTFWNGWRRLAPRLEQNWNFNPNLPSKAHLANSLDWKVDQSDQIHRTRKQVTSKIADQFAKQLICACHKANWEDSYESFWSQGHNW